MNANTSIPPDGKKPKLVKATVVLTDFNIIDPGDKESNQKANVYLLLTLDFEKGENPQRKTRYKLAVLNPEGYWDNLNKQSEFKRAFVCEPVGPDPNRWRIFVEPLDGVSIPDMEGQKDSTLFYFLANFSKDLRLSLASQKDGEDAFELGQYTLEANRWIEDGHRIYVTAEDVKFSHKKGGVAADHDLLKELVKKLKRRTDIHDITEFQPLHFPENEQ